MIEIQRRIVEWADREFPERTAHAALTKLVLEEIPEFLMDLDSPGEYADLLILLFDVAHLRGIDIIKAVEDKMVINENRKWRINKETGIAKHIED